MKRAVFVDKTRMHPMLRLAVLLCNLSAEKAEDGIGKLLVKSDVARIASKAKAAVAKECEEVLLKSKQIAEALDMAEDETLLPLGQLFVRVGLYATGKCKAGREQKDRTVIEVKKLFLDALSAKWGRAV